jgi:hypothetical protein
LIINSRFLHSFVALFQVAALVAMVSTLMSAQLKPTNGLSGVKDKQAGVKAGIES